MILKPTVIRVHWLLSSQFGVDLLRFLRSLRGLPRFIGDWRKFRKGYSGPLTWMPCLYDRYEEGGTTKSEYFLQDLLIARWIFEAQPQKHVDIGSRVNGFVAHLATFRQIDVYDIRPINTKVPNVVFKQMDLMRPLDGDLDAYCDSLSCLHVIEHFGLGRYGDPIEPEGYRLGIANMAKLLKPGGLFYLSTPIGQERVEFNANRVFDPRTIIQCVKRNGLCLERLVVIDRAGVVTDAPLTEESLLHLSLACYNLGIFVFVKADL